MLNNPIIMGKKLPVVTNPGTADDLLTGKQLIDQNGNVLTGAMPIQVAQTITPGTANQTIPQGRYLSGSQTILGDQDLIAGNIKEGVSIFGVTGNYKGSGGTTTNPHMIDPVYNTGISPTITSSYWEIILPTTYNRVINSAITQVPLNLDEVVAIGADGGYDGDRQGTSSVYTPFGFVVVHPFSPIPIGFGDYFTYESYYAGHSSQLTQAQISHSGRRFRYIDSHIASGAFTNWYIIMSS